MLRVVVVLVVLGVTVYALVDCARSNGPELRLLSKPLWLLVILLLPLAGPVLYLMLGRAPEAPPGPAARPLAPDDDPEFLRRLELERRRRLAEDERRRRGRAAGGPVVPGSPGASGGTAPGADRPDGAQGDSDGDDHSGTPA
jgi:Phospholipase_D-nuclease N-terminal